jgi:hypothetical protein
MGGPELAVATIAEHEGIVILQPCDNSGTVTNSLQQLNLEQCHGKNSTPRPEKKSLPFKLAFSGLALILVVFQLDATCLSIALPVSQSTQPTKIALRTPFH